MNSHNTPNIRSKLMRAMSHLEQRVLIREIDALSERLAALEGTLQQRVVRLLAEGSEIRFDMFTRFQELLAALPKLRTDREKNQHMLEFLAGFTGEKELREDRKAFDRWMDLTGVRERARVAMHESDRHSEMLLLLLRDLLVESFAEMPAAGIGKSWAELDVSRHLENELNDSPRWQNQVTVLKVLEGLCRSLQEKAWQQIWTDAWDRRVKNLLSSPEENIWLQVQAFKLCVAMEPSHALAMIHHRLNTPAAGGNDVFLRTCLLDILQQNYPVSELGRIVSEVLRRPDPSEHVLIAAASKIASIPAAGSLQILELVIGPAANGAFTDKIRASAAISLESILTACCTDGSGAELLDAALGLLEKSLEPSGGRRLQTALVEALGKTALAHAAAIPGNTIDALDHRILSNLDRVIGTEQYTSQVRRKASEIRETIILNRDPAARRLYETILAEGRTLPPGESFIISADQVPDEEILGRVLARISITDYGYYAQPANGGYRIWRGELFKRRLWRIIHELNNPDPAKRQGYVHTTGRSYPGTIRAHARYLAETTETKVPGERLFFRKEYSWRPFIPTVDDLLSLTLSRDAGRTIRLFSPEGVFSLTGPGDFTERFSLWWHITLNYKALVQKRNYELEDVQSGHARNFVQVLQEDLGFTTDFKPHAYVYQEKSHSVIDPQFTVHMYPLIRTQFEWRPLS